MNIEHIAEIAGISTDAIRYHLMRELPDEAHPTVVDHSHFDERALVRLKFVLNARVIGLSLREMLEFLRLTGDLGEPRMEICDRDQNQTWGMHKRLKAFEEVREALMALLISYSETLPGKECPLECVIEEEVLRW